MEVPESKIALVKDAPGYLHDNFFKFILDGEYCFRGDIDSCNMKSVCRCHKARVDVCQEPNVRKAFRARDGYAMAAVDYSGVELRIAANLSREPVWLNAFLSGKDLHGETAKVIFGEGYSKLQRQMAKCIRRGTKIKFRMVSPVKSPGSYEITCPAVEVLVDAGTIYLLEESGALVLNPQGKEERKLAKDLRVGDYFVEVRDYKPALNFKRAQQVLGTKDRKSVV